VDGVDDLGVREVDCASAPAQEIKIAAARLLERRKVCHP
jgi:hypothetical protein